MGRKKSVVVKSISDRLCGDELPAVRSMLSRLEDDLREMDEELGSLEKHDEAKGEKKAVRKKEKGKKF